MTRLTHIYLVGTPPTGSFTSLGRSWQEPSRVRAFDSVDAAVDAEARGDVCIPGYFAGEDDPSPMSTATPTEVIEALKEAGIDEHLRLDIWRGELSMWAEKTNLWFEKLTPEQTARLREIFDRHADPAIVGRRSIYRVEVK